MDIALRHRVNAGRQAVGNQISFFVKQFGQVASEWKADHTRVTFADFAISERIFAELRNSFPDDNYCSEESNPADGVMALSGRYTWVLDPIDGTNNFALGMPSCAISLGLLKDGEPVYGFLYDHSLQRCLEGGPGQGIWVDGKRHSAEPRPFEPRSAVVGLHFPLPPERLTQLQPMLTQYRARSIGSAALNLAHTALGTLDGCLDFRVRVWDIAAAAPLMLAAGGELHFLEHPAFPLREFSVEAPKTPYISGPPAFCRWALSLFA